MCVSCRATGGHVRRARQLQHHSKRAEALLQQAAGGERPVGESESCHGDLSRLSWTSMRNVPETLQQLSSHSQFSHHIDVINHVKPQWCSAEALVHELLSIIDIR